MPAVLDTWGLRNLHEEGFFFLVKQSHRGLLTFRFIGKIFGTGTSQWCPLVKIRVLLGSVKFTVLGASRMLQDAQHGKMPNVV